MESFTKGECHAHNGRRTECSAGARRERAKNALTQHLALLGKDMDRWIELWDDDAVMEFAFAASVGFPPKLEGKQAIWAVMSEFPKQFQGIAFSHIQIYPMLDPDSLVAEFRGEAKIAATGRHYAQSYLARVHVKDGKIVSYVEYWDPMVVLEGFRDRQTMMKAFSGG